MDPELANNPGDGADALNPELAQDANQLDNEQVVENEDGEPQPPADETEEIEHEGVKHRIPKALKGAFLMQTDYTRKTQEVAEQRRAAEELRTTVQKQAEEHQAFLQDYGTLTALKRAIEQYSAIDWRTLEAQNPEQAARLDRELRQLERAHAQHEQELHTKVNKRQQDAAAETARRQSELRTSLARDIPGYTPELATKMQTFGVATYGFSADEISATTDPRLHRLMHDAMLGREAISKAAKAAAAAKTAAAVEGVKPPAQVGNRAQSAKVNPASKDGDRLSTAEWMRRRDEQARAAPAR